MHELDPDQGVLSGRKRLEAEHGTGDPLDTTMILFHDIIQVFDLTDGDR